jgi:hypothetical protein
LSYSEKILAPGQPTYMPSSGPLRFEMNLNQLAYEIKNVYKKAEVKKSR